MTGGAQDSKCPFLDPKSGGTFQVAGRDHGVTLVASNTNKFLHVFIQQLLMRPFVSTREQLILFLLPKPQGSWHDPHTYRMPSVVSRQFKNIVLSRVEHVMKTLRELNLFGSAGLLAPTACDRG